MVTKSANCVTFILCWWSDYILIEFYLVFMFQVRNAGFVLKFQSRWSDIKIREIEVRISERPIPENFPSGHGPIPYEKSFETVVLYLRDFALKIHAKRSAKLAVYQIFSTSFIHIQPTWRSCLQKNSNSHSQRASF